MPLEPLINSLSNTALMGNSEAPKPLRGYKRYMMGFRMNNLLSIWKWSIITMVMLAKYRLNITKFETDEIGFKMNQHPFYLYEE